MSYSPELIAKIRKLHFYEHHTVHAVSKSVGLHRDTVKRILYPDGSSPAQSEKRVKIIDPYMEVIENHLKEYPNIPATVLNRILTDKGYAGSLTTVRRAVRPMRKKHFQSYNLMSTFPGQQAQVDWAHFGTLNGVRIK